MDPRQVLENNNPQQTLQRFTGREIVDCVPRQRQPLANITNQINSYHSVKQIEREENYSMGTEEEEEEEEEDQEEETISQEVLSFVSFE